MYRNLITLAFTQHGHAQMGFAADDLNELDAVDQLLAAPGWAEEDMLLLIIGIDQADLYAAAVVAVG